MRKYRSYVFSVVFKRGKRPKFLLLHRKKNWRGWELPKGGLKEEEKALEGLKREIQEETGSKDFKVIARTRHFLKYDFPKGFLKDNHIFHGAKGYLFLVEFLGKKVRVDRNEHDGYLWVEKDSALKLLTHKNQKDALKYIVERYSLS